MKNILKSRAAVIAAAATIVIIGGGATAQASGLIDGGDIQNGSITSVDVDNGTIRSADIVNGENGVQSVDVKDGSIQPVDLDPAVSDALLVKMENSGQLNNANWKTQWSGPATGVASIGVPNDSMVSLNAEAQGDQPVLVEFQLAGLGTAMRCVTVPSQFGNFCSVTDVLTAGSYTVSATGGTATVSVNGITVG